MSKLGYCAVKATRCDQTLLFFITNLSAKATRRELTRSSHKYVTYKVSYNQCKEVYKNNVRQGKCTAN